MARLNCPVCRAWLADVSDESWRIVEKGQCTVESAVSSSADLWADLDLVEKRADEWRIRGVYEPLPPPPDPPLATLVLTCDCGHRSQFERPGHGEV
jgi:hypothetical protein